VKATAKPQPQASKAPASAVAPLVDAVNVESTAAGKTSLASQNLKSSSSEALTVTDGGKPSSVQTAAAPKKIPTANPNAPVSSTTTPIAKKPGPSAPEGGIEIKACNDCTGKLLTKAKLLEAGLIKRPGAEPVFAPIPLSPQSPTTDSITAGTVTPTSGTTFNAVHVGPPLAPLVPSQVCVQIFLLDFSHCTTLFNS